MDEQLFEKFPELETLLLNKGFAELSGTERERVLLFMDKGTYDAYRQVLLTSKSALSDEDAEIKPRAGSKAVLMKKFEESGSAGREKALLPMLLTARIPVYQVSVAAVAIICLLVYFRLTEVQNGNKTITKVIHDTVFVDKQLAQAAEPISREPEARPAGYQKKQSRPTKPADRKVSLDKLADSYALQIRNMDKLVELSSKSKVGSNAVDDSLLMKLLVTVN